LLKRPWVGSGSCRKSRIEERDEERS